MTMYCWCCLIVTIKILVVLSFFFFVPSVGCAARSCAHVHVVAARCGTYSLVASVSWYVQPTPLPPPKFPAPAAYDAHALANLLPVATSLRPRVCV